MVAVNELALTKLLVYGTTTPGPDPNTHIRPNNTSSASPPLNISMINYLTTGAGRYAKPSEVPLIASFFNDSASSTPKLSDGTYTVATLATALGLTVSPGLLRFNVSQYTTDPSSSDFIERAYVFGSTGFEINNTVTFTVNSGTYTVNNFEIIARQDNFDFQSSNPIATTANAFLNEAFDPYGLIPVVGATTVPVDIIYTGSGRNYSTYTQANFNTDSALVDGWTSSLNLPIAAANFAGALAGLGTNTGYLGAINSDLHFSYYTPTRKKIIYGTPDNDTITVSSAEPTLDIYFDYQMVGGDGNDQITGGDFGDELWGGPGSDTLDGGLGDDTFIGGKGDDEIDGGSFLFGLFEGTDTSVYNGAFADYELEFLPDDSIRIVDTVNNRDGSDTLSGVDFAQFSDKTINLAPGQDIAFVIDTTGSMFDDIDAVKARSSEIINIIFDGDRGFIDSRIAVVGYNDPGTNTFLSFTDQPKIEDRKTAALNAINSISVGGGGDIPEVVNSGLIRALSGGAGKWREEAIARRIILFGDAPPKDTELRAEVLKLAADIGVDVPPEPSSAPLSIASDIETTSLTSGLTVTRFEAATVDADGGTTTFPVEIFTIVIGDDPTTTTDFESLATATDGQSFKAANASELVDTLIAAIESPTAVTDTATTSSEALVTIDVLANDSDPQADSLSIIEVNGNSVVVEDEITLASGALLTFNSDNTFTYNPNGQFDFLTVGETATDTFIYTISDGSLTDSATVTLTVIKNNVNEAPTVNDATFAVDENSNEGTQVGIITATDPENEVLTFSITNGNLDPDNDANLAFIIDSSTGAITVNDKDDFDFESTPSFDLEITATDTGGLSNTANITVNLNDIPPAQFDAVQSQNNFFTLNGGDPTNIKFTLANNNTENVNEVGVFVVDDENGSVDGNAPGSEGYLKAALQKAQVIFSAIADRPTGFDLADIERVLEVDSDARLGFYLISNGTTDTALDELESTGTTSLPVFFSNSSNLQVSDLTTESFNLNWSDQIGGGEFTDMELRVELTQDAPAPFTELQGEAHKELIDLRNEIGQVSVSVEVHREAAFDNLIGFYQITDTNGGIDTNGDGIADFNPGDVGYEEAALTNRVTGLDLLQTDNQQTTTFDGTFDGGSILASFMVVDGTVDEAINDNAEVYFSFLGANSDGSDHIRLLGDNTFGYEDLSGGGDKDFNDVIVRVDFPTA